MTRIHALVIAVAVSFAVAAGAFAAFRTTQLGEATAGSVSPVGISAQNRQLDESEAALRRSLGARPPKLPKVPKLKRPAVPTGTPPPVVRVVHAARVPTTTAATTTTAPATTATVAATTPRVVTTAPTTTSKSSPHQGEHESGSDDTTEHTTSTSTTPEGPDD